MTLVPCRRGVADGNCRTSRWRAARRHLPQRRDHDSTSVVCCGIRRAHLAPRSRASETFEAPASDAARMLVEDDEPVEHQPQGASGNVGSLPHGCYRKQLSHDSVCAARLRHAMRARGNPLGGKNCLNGTGRCSVGMHARTDPRPRVPRCGKQYAGELHVSLTDDRRKTCIARGRTAGDGRAHTHCCCCTSFTGVWRCDRGIRSRRADRDAMSSQLFRCAAADRACRGTGRRTNRRRARVQLDGSD